MYSLEKMGKPVVVQGQHGALLFIRTNAAIQAFFNTDHCYRTLGLLVVHGVVNVTGPDGRAMFSQWRSWLEDDEQRIYDIVARNGVWGGDSPLLLEGMHRDALTGMGMQYSARGDGDDTDPLVLMRAHTAYDKYVTDRDSLEECLASGGPSIMAFTQVAEIATGGSHRRLTNEVHCELHSELHNKFHSEIEEVNDDDDDDDDAQKPSTVNPSPKPKPLNPTQPLNPTHVMLDALANEPDPVCLAILKAMIAGVVGIAILTYWVFR